MKYSRIIIPLLNHQFTTFEEPVWNLADKVSCRTISDIDFGALWRYLDEIENEQYRSLFNLKTKCIYLEYIPILGDNTKITEYAQYQATLIQSVLNLFSESSPVVMSFAMIVEVKESEKENKTDVLNVMGLINLEPVSNISDFRAQPYKLRLSATQGRINQFYRVICEVAKKYPQVYVTLRRFNSSLTRATESDRLIDITVSLESLIRERNELNFKFATYLSFVAGKTPQERFYDFHILYDLYSARSGLVHGTSEDKYAKKAFEEVLKNWESITSLAKNVISYYLFYLYSEIKNTVQFSWKDHLNRLMLGVDSRIFD